MAVVRFSKNSIRSTNPKYTNFITNMFSTVQVGNGGYISVYRVTNATNSVGGSYDVYVWSSDIDSSGNTYVCGQTYSYPIDNAGYWLSWVAKLDASGNQVWTKYLQTNGRNNQSFDLVYAADQSAVYLATAQNGDDAYIVKLNASDGSTAFVRKVGLSGVSGGSGGLRSYGLGYFNNNIVPLYRYNWGTQLEGSVITRINGSTAGATDLYRTGPTNNAIQWVGLKYLPILQRYAAFGAGYNSDGIEVCTTNLNSTLDVQTYSALRGAGVDAGNGKFYDVCDAVVSGSTKIYAVGQGNDGNWFGVIGRLETGGTWDWRYKLTSTVGIVEPKVASTGSDFITVYRTTASFGTIYIIRYDSNGDIVWQRKLSHSSLANIYTAQLRILGSFYYLSGYLYTTTSGTYQAFSMKLPIDGSGTKTYVVGADTDSPYYTFDYAVTTDIGRAASHPSPTSPSSTRASTSITNSASSMTAITTSLTTLAKTN